MAEVGDRVQGKALPEFVQVPCGDLGIPALDPHQHWRGSRRTSGIDLVPAVLREVRAMGEMGEFLALWGELGAGRISR